jgi:transcriptional regulator with XRE-family HTH domain
MRFSTPSIPSALLFRQEQYGWTQRQMAKRLGIEESHYNEILKGKRRLPFAAACRAYKIGIPASVLLALKNQRAIEAKS